MFACLILILIEFLSVYKSEDSSSKTLSLVVSSTVNLTPVLFVC